MGQSIRCRLVAACLSTNANHRALLLHPPHNVPLLGAPGVGINAQNRRDARLVLLVAAMAIQHHVALIGAAKRRHGRRVPAAADGRRGGRAAAAAAAAAVAAAVAPHLLEHRRVHAVAVVGGDGRPERGAVRVVHGVQAAHVDGLRRRGRRGGDGAVQAEGGGRGGAAGAGGAGRRGEARGREKRRGVLGAGVVVLQGGGVARRAEGEGRHVGGLGEDGGQARRVAVVGAAAAHDAGQLDAALAADSVAGKRAGGGDAAAAGALVDRRGDAREHHGRVAGRGAAGGHGGGALAAVAAVAELVVVQAAGELGLLQVRGDVLVGHLLQAGLKQVNLLKNGPVSMLVPRTFFMKALPSVS